MYPMSRPRNLRAICLFILLTTSLPQAQAPASISAALREKIDVITKQTLTSTGVPSASIAIVQGGAITYVQAYADCPLQQPRPAVPSMRYSAGSISQQCTARGGG